MIASGDRDGYVHVWNCDDYQCVSSLRAVKGEILNMVGNEGEEVGDFKLMAVAADGLKVWDLKDIRSHKCVRNIEEKGLKNAIFVSFNGKEKEKKTIVAVKFDEIKYYYN